jgi:hypothetical protein
MLTGRERVRNRGVNETDDEQLIDEIRGVKKKKKAAAQ